MAEYHETLQHILLFFVLYPAAPTLSRSTSRTSLHASSSSKPKTVHPLLQDLSAHVLPPVIGPPEDGDHLVIKLKSGTTSLPLILPAHVPPGQKEITDATEFWQIRMNVVPKPKEDEDDDESLLDAPTLTRLAPASFNCISCSLSLVSVDSATYRDLPSSHWEELVESWMCHEDLKVSKEVQEREKKGFIPQWNDGKGDIFVGGSYMLLPYEAIVHRSLFGVSDLVHFALPFPFLFLFLFYFRACKKARNGAPPFPMLLFYPSLEPTVVLLMRRMCNRALSG